MHNDYQAVLAICMSQKEDIIKNLSTIMTNTIYQYYEQYYVFHAINPILPKLNHLINSLPNDYNSQKQFLISDCEKFRIESSATTLIYAFGSLVRDLDNLDSIINSRNQEQKKKLPENKGTCKKIFISHSSKDKEIVDEFVTLLTRGAGLTQDDIFCTSIEGMKIKNGEDIRKHIQENINYTDFAILLISNNYKESEICLNEMGAVWAIDKKVISYVFPDLREEQVGWLINNNAVEKINNISALASLYEELQKFYNLPLQMKGWTAQANAFCEKFKCMT